MTAIFAIATRWRYHNIHDSSPGQRALLTPDGSPPGTEDKELEECIL